MSILVTILKHQFLSNYKINNTYNKTRKDKTIV